MSDEREPDQPGWAAPTPPPPPPGAAPAPPPAPPPAAPPPLGSEWGAPPPPTGPTSRPRRHRRWPWLLGGVLGLIVILLVSGIVLFVTKLKPPIDAANAFLEEIDDRDFRGAIDEMCRADRDSFTTENLQLVFAFGRLAEDYSVNFFGVDVDGSTATVDFDSDAVDDDFDYYELPLRKEDGDWHVCLSDDPSFRSSDGGDLGEL